MRQDIGSSGIQASPYTVGSLGRSWGDPSGVERSSTTRIGTSSITGRAIYTSVRAKPSMNTSIASTAISIRKKISKSCLLQKIAAATRKASPTIVYIPRIGCIIMIF